MLHLFASLERGGAEQRTLEMVLSRPDEAFAFQVATLSGRGGPLEREFVLAGAQVHHLTLKSGRFPGQLRRLVRTQRIDIVHSHVDIYSGVVLFLARWFGVRGRVAHFRSDGTGLESTRWKRLLGAGLRLLLDHSATVIVGVSPSALDCAWRSTWASDPRCRVLLSGLDLDRAERGIRTADSARTDLGASDSVHLVLHVGRDIPSKNRARALNVFGRIADADSDAMLVFLGREDPRELQRWHAVAASLGVHDRIVNLGDRADALRFIAAADLLLVTSTREGLPGVVAEAATVGTPVLASDLPGVRFLAERLGGINVLDLEQPDRCWAAAAVTLLSHRPDSDERLARVAATRGTEFDVRVAEMAYRRVWRDAVIVNRPSGRDGR